MAIELAENDFLWEKTKVLRLLLDKNMDFKQRNR